MIESPRVRPGNVEATEPVQRIIAHFRSSSQANLAIQRLVCLGVPSDQLGVISPERLEEKQGMILSIACFDPTLIDHVASLCKTLGAEVHRPSS